MKKSMKAVMVGMCVMMASTMFVGCGDTTSDSSAGGQPNADLDLNKRVIKVQYTGSDIPTGDDLQGWLDTEKKLNCKFEFSKANDEISAYNSFVTNYLAGKPEIDAMQMRGYNVAPTYAASGVLLDMSSVYDFSADSNWQDPRVKDEGVWKGKRYGIPTSPKETGYAIWYNKAMLRDANIPDLWEYIEKGTWNFDTFRDVAKKLTVTSGNKTTRYGFVEEQIFPSFALANGGVLIDPNEKDVAKTLSSDNNIEAFRFVMDLYNVDKSVPNSKDMEDMGNLNVLDMFANGKVAMCSYNVWAGPVFQKAGIAPEDLGYIYYPKGPKADDYVVPSSTNPTMMVVPANVEKGDQVVAALADALAFWSADKTNPVSLDDYAKNVIEYDELLDIMVGNNAKCYLEGAVKTKYSLLLNYEGALADFQKMFKKMEANELTPKAAIDTYAGKIQGSIEMVEQGINLDDFK